MSNQTTNNQPYHGEPDKAENAKKGNVTTINTSPTNPIDNHGIGNASPGLNGQNGQQASDPHSTLENNGDANTAQPQPKDDL